MHIYIYIYIYIYITEGLRSVLPGVGGDRRGRAGDAALRHLGPRAEYMINNEDYRSIWRLPVLVGALLV